MKLNTHTSCNTCSSYLRGKQVNMIPQLNCDLQKVNYIRFPTCICMYLYTSTPASSPAICRLYPSIFQTLKPIAFLVPAIVFYDACSLSPSWNDLICWQVYKPVNINFSSDMYKMIISKLLLIGNVFNRPSWIMKRKKKWQRLLVGTLRWH